MRTFGVPGNVLDKVGRVVPSIACPHTTHSWQGRVMRRVVLTRWPGWVGVADRQIPRNTPVSHIYAAVLSLRIRSTYPVCHDTLAATTPYLTSPMGITRHNWMSGLSTRPSLQLIEPSNPQGLAQSPLQQMHKGVGTPVSITEPRVTPLFSNTDVLTWVLNTWR